jgi:hypothetical protein
MKPIAYSTLPCHREGMPEETLWCEVIGRAVADLVTNEKQGEKVRREAAYWIFGPDLNGDFALACQHAGLDPGWVRRIATEAPTKLAAMLAKQEKKAAAQGATA